MLKISLDVDGTIFNFVDHYINNFGVPKTNLEITKNVRGVLLKDKEFWLTQPLINTPNFIPYCYCTARLINKNLIKQQLKLNSLPKAPIYQVYGISLSKYPQLKRAGIDVHIDDSISNFIDLNLKGIPCLLIDNPDNQEWGPIGRIYSLNKEEITDCYYLFKDTLFDYFLDIVNEYRRVS